MDIVVHYEFDKKDSWLTAIPAEYNFWRCLEVSPSACCCLSTYKEIVWNVQIPAEYHRYDKNNT